MATAFDRQFDKYHDYEGSSEYVYDDGCEVVPLLKPAQFGGPHFRVVQVHAPVGFRRVRGSGSKTGTPPVIPAMGDTPSGDRLLEARVLVVDPQTLGPRKDVRTYGARWDLTYAQCVNPPAGTVAPAEAVVGVARGAVTGTGTRKPARFQAGRPPFVRHMVDATFLMAARLLGYVPWVGGSLSAYIEAVLDAGLDQAGRSDAAPDLTDTAYVDGATDYRPQYQSDGIIR